MSYGHIVNLPRKSYCEPPSVTQYDLKEVNAHTDEGFVILGILWMLVSIEREWKEDPGGGGGGGCGGVGELTYYNQYRYISR